MEGLSTWLLLIPTLQSWLFYLTTAWYWRQVSMLVHLLCCAVLYYVVLCCLSEKTDTPLAILLASFPFLSWYSWPTIHRVIATRFQFFSCVVNFSIPTSDWIWISHVQHRARLVFWCLAYLISLSISFPHCFVLFCFVLFFKQNKTRALLCPLCNNSTQQSQCAFLGSLRHAQYVF